MRFKLDENLPIRAAEVLRAAGHDTANLLDQVAAGARDASVAELVRRGERVLITLDLDFADIRAYQPSDYRGIVVLRPRRSSADEILRLLSRVATAIEREPLEGRLWIVEGHRIRIRGESG
jgi:predicted nuclease of predicted toxin-antitoxin system